MAPPFDVNAAAVVDQAAYVQQVVDTRAEYKAGKSWPPVSVESGPAAVPAVKAQAQRAEPSRRWRTVASGQRVQVGGATWVAQSGTTDGISISDDGHVAFRAKTGERASFDPARKIRAELSSVTTYGKGEPIRLAGSFWIDPQTNIGNSQWCSIYQIHQSDTRRANGTLVEASPLFSMEITLRNGSPFLRVRAETSKGIPEPGKFPPVRILSESTPVAFGVEHTFESIVIDGHGDKGSVFLSIDGKTVVDFVGPTGYEYVDLLAAAFLDHNGKEQSRRSYPKIGIYAGISSGNTPPERVSIGYRVKIAD